MDQGRKPARRTTRREFLRNATTGVAGLFVIAAPARGAAQKITPIPVSHSINTSVYAPTLVAEEKGFFREGGLQAQFITPGAGARVVQALTAGQALFAQGDSNHPLKITEKGKPALMLYATDTRCSYANIVVRRELFDAGLTSVERLATMRRRDGSPLVIAATAIGSGTWLYGTHVLKQFRLPDGKSVNDQVKWVSGGSSQTMLGGLKAGQFDAIMAVPVWIFKAEDEGFGKSIYNVLDEAAWRRGFGGNIPVTVGYCLRETAEGKPEVTQSYVNAVYRALQWLKTAAPEQVYDLIGKKYMETFSRDEVIREIAYYRTIFAYDGTIGDRDYENGMRVWYPDAVGVQIPFAQAVDMRFLRKAQQLFG